MRLNWSTTITSKEQFDSPVVRFVGVVFTLIGIASLFVALRLALFAPDQQIEWIETKAVITHFGQNGYPDVTYSVDGRQYTAHLSSKNAFQHIGDEVTVRYNPEDPGDVKTARTGWGM